VARAHAAVAADEELGEVPLDRARAEQPRRLAGQPLPLRVRAGAGDLDLGHHREAHAVALAAERGDTGVAARVLRAELVAREGGVKADDPGQG
jgi:hypothetical protein